MPCPSKISVGEMGKQAFDKVSRLCCWYLFPLEVYCSVLAGVGLLVTTIDIHRVLADGPRLLDDVLPMRREGQPVSEEAERDVKLVTSVVEWTVYFCLLVGSHYKTPLFLLPWLSIRLFILISSVVLFFLNLALQKPMKVSAMGLTGGLLAIHNFLYVLCLFKILIASRRATSWFERN